ncbi:unnamed protein product [Prunus armeniaca]|uniref:Secreted protein n=1 Tax=Prunus armeniaca TaxID=36596 RepID=A0A6J5XL54_PRUAR|nr:unnamed protein product [Prunus armeniaca]
MPILVVCPCLHCLADVVSTCGAEWKNKRAACFCQIWDVSNIIREQPRHAPPIIPEQPRQVWPQR